MDAHNSLIDRLRLCGVYADSQTISGSIVNRYDLAFLALSVYPSAVDDKVVVYARRFSAIARTAQDRDLWRFWAHFAQLSSTLSLSSGQVDSIWSYRVRYYRARAYSVYRD